MFWLKRHKVFIFLLILGFVGLLVTWPLFHKGFFVTDDGEWMVIRFSAFHQALRDGQFPVRWLGRLNQEYGYPVANFLYPGFMYLAEIPKVLGLGFVDSVKIVIIGSVFGSAIFTFLWLKNLFSPEASFLGSIFYLLAPYHLWDLYKRGSVGELLALAVVPFIFWSIEKKNSFLYPICLGFLLISHNILALLFLPIIFSYVFLRKLLTANYLLLTTILGFGLAAFFWLPAIYDLQYTKFFQTQVSNWSEYFVNLNLIGGSTIIIFLLSAIMLLRIKNYNDFFVEKLCLNHCSKVVIFIFLIGLLSTFLALHQSSFLWRILPVSFIQFPFRLLSVTILCGAYLLAFVMDQSGKRWKPFLFSIMFVIIIISAVQYLKPPEFFDKQSFFSNKGEGFYATNMGTTTVANEYMPKQTTEIPTKKPDQKIEIISGKDEISNLFANSRKIIFNTSFENDEKIQINTLYFPGWVAKIDNQFTLIRYRNIVGIMELDIPMGNHQVNVEFKETPLRLVADAISLISLMGLIILASLGVRKFKSLRL